MSSMAEHHRKRKEEEERHREESQLRFVERSFTSESSGVKSGQELHQLYCSHCGHFSMIYDTVLSNCSQREIDFSTVLRLQGHTHRLILDEGDRRVIKRQNGLEVQYRYNCKGCTLPLAYAFDRFDQSHELLFLIDGAMSDDPNSFKDKFSHLKPKSDV